MNARHSIIVFLIICVASSCYILLKNKIIDKVMDDAPGLESIAGQPEIGERVKAGGNRPGDRPQGGQELNLGLKLLTLLEPYLKGFVHKKIEVEVISSSLESDIETAIEDLMKDLSKQDLLESVVKQLGLDKPKEKVEHRIEEKAEVEGITSSLESDIETAIEDLMKDLSKQGLLESVVKQLGLDKPKENREKVEHRIEEELDTSSEENEVGPPTEPGEGGS